MFIKSFFFMAPRKNVSQSHDRRGALAERQSRWTEDSKSNYRHKIVSVLVYRLGRVSLT